MSNEKKKKPRISEAIRVAIIAGVFSLIAALIGRTWVCSEQKLVDIAIEILDKDTHLGVPEVTINIKPIGLNGITNENGKFNFNTYQNPKVNLSISLSKNGYEPQFLTIFPDSPNLHKIFFVKKAVYDSLFIGPQ